MTLEEALGKILQDAPKRISSANPGEKKNSIPVGRSC